MGVSSGKNLERRSYVLAIVVSMFVIISNTLFIFDRMNQLLPVYFAAVMCINIVITTLLANATYYTSRIRIDELYVSLSFYLFIMITDYIISLIVIVLRPTDALEIISLFLGFGRLFFVFGILTLKWRKTLRWIYVNKFRMVLVSVCIILVQALAVYALYQSKISRETVVFLVNGMIALLLVVLNYEIVLEDHTDNSYTFLFAFSTMLIAQLLVTLTNSSYEIQIQSQILLGVGLMFFFYHVNLNNFLIPERNQERLQRQFNLYSMNLKKIIDKKTFQVREVNQKFIDELEYAKKIQQSLLPNANMSYRDVNFVSEYFPCERLSGDFYDHYRLDDDNIALYLLDVSGHGLSAALLTMFSNNYLKSNDKNQQLFRGLKPDRTLAYFYEQFNEMNFPDEMHMVIFYATLNLSTKMLTYCSAGLNCSPIRFRKNGRIDYLDKSDGFPICKLGDFITPEYRSERVKLEKGDRLLFYTDGLIDKDKNNTFDLESLIHFVTINKNDSINELNEKLVNAINPFKQSLNDDITYILMEI